MEPYRSESSLSPLDLVDNGFSGAGLVPMSPRASVWKVILNGGEQAGNVSFH